MLEAFFRRLLQVVVDRQLHPPALDRLYFLERADFAPHAVDDDALGAILAHQQLVVDALDARLADDRPGGDAVAHLRVVRFADVAEDVRRQRVRRVLPRRHFLDDDVRKFEIEPSRRERGNLRERRVLDNDDRAVGRLAAVAVDNLLHLGHVQAGHRGQQPDRSIEILGVLADDGNVEGVAVLDQHFAVAVEQHAARRPQRERPLVIVLRHLLEAGVLDDLEEPETDRQRRECHDDAHLENGEANRDAATIFSQSHRA